jgi:dTDP-4-dehydrorhamnose 3,5-epimerase
MNKFPTNAPVNGVKYFSATQFLDNRGAFTKTWSSEWDHDEAFSAREVFYSNSLTGVIRGMHLQIREAASPRYVTVQEGRILDVILDLRPHSPTFLNFQSVEMDVVENCTVYVPSGVAHGFQALKDSRTLYLSGESHVASLDSGFNTDSFGFTWPIGNPIKSERDKALPPFTDWITNNL